ncbi:MAG TPA: ABC transporter ATP-binding protein [Candidatus Kapabacteria bacterium]|nr:ABC transporter ATP-binding protein [Candidatus Kapabacteria bacterium]
MHQLQITCDNLRKNFIRNYDIFSNINLSFTNKDIVGLIGSNGSGKSTLLKILAGVLSPTLGKVSYNINGKIIEKSNWNKHYAYVAPYVNLYEEFTPLEHYKIMASIKNIEYNQDKLLEGLEFFKLDKNINTQIKGFSSGMKQRFKFILAEQSNPDILYLDEPTSNLDSDGISKVFQLIANRTQYGSAVIIATNEDRERELCSKIFNIMDYKKSEK